MAAKKLQDYVKGKISNSTVGPIHFSSSNNGLQEKSTLNITKLHQSFDEKFESDQDIFNPTQNKLQFTSDAIENENVNNAQTPSSSKSSPDSKPKWGSHITDVKKNINSAVDDAYSLFNNLLKEHVNKLETKTYQIEDCSAIDKNNQSIIRASKTMSNIDKMGCLDGDGLSDISVNKSLDNLTIDNNENSKNRSDLDTVDFKWLPTPKNVKRNKIKNRYSKSETPVPPKIQESLIENFKFPDSKTVPSPEINIKTKWPIFVGIIILLIVMILTNLQLFMGFGIGIITCLWCLDYFGVLKFQSINRIVSLPALKDLHSPMIPHIQKDNFEDRDIHATEDSCFSGWINLLFNYDINNYNINHSYAVHVDIEQDSRLRIRRPKRKVARRGMWNESRYQLMTFTSEIVISLEKVKIDLLPAGLVKKRLWSKKYPIFIELPKPLNEYEIEKSNFEALIPSSNCLYLFCRTCREKEEWFRRLLFASTKPSLDLNMWNIIQNYLTKQRSSIHDSPMQNSSTKSNESGHRKSFSMSQPEDESRKVTYYHSSKDDDENQEPSIETLKWKQDNKTPQLAEYVKYMSKFMPADLFLLTSEVMQLDINYVTCNPEILCINAFLGRIFWDFLRGPHWVKVIQNKIQCKLKKMHLPQFIDQLTVVDIHFGKEIPLIRKFGRPYLDSRGLWVDAEVAYTGGFSMILETKINLFNLRNQLKKNVVEESTLKPGSPDSNSEINKADENQKLRSQSMASEILKTAAYASSEEDSAESSSNSDDSGEERDFLVSVEEFIKTGRRQTSQIVTPSNQAGSGGSSKRIIRWVDKIARSPYFIKAADNKYIQRGMEIVSNTKLMLQVEVHSVCGTLALNIPPPPSDRLWFGFRPSPILKMSAKPKVGQKEISISKITDLIEKKLILEFQKVLVLPNMDDIPLPLLINGNVENYCSNL